jgi:hypothetical protein
MTLLSTLVLAVVVTSIGLLAKAAASNEISSEPSQAIQSAQSSTDEASAVSSGVFVLVGFLAMIGGLLFHWGGDLGNAGTADTAVPGWNRASSD